MTYFSQAAYDAAEPDDDDVRERSDEFREPDDEPDGYYADQAESRWAEGRGL